MNTTKSGMSTLNALDRVYDYVSGFRIDYRRLQIGRSIIAAAHLTVIVFTGTGNIFAPQLGLPDFPHCDSFSQTASLYCVSPAGNSWNNVIASVVLVWVITGFLPRYSSILHWWICLSIGISWSLPDGGEAVARVITLLLIPVCFGDRRICAWSKHSRYSRVGIANFVGFVFIWAVRIQVAYIYFDSTIAKFGVPEWVDGSAEYYIVRGSMFGTSGPAESLVLWFTSQPWGTILMSWGALALEMVIAIGILFSGSKVIRRIVVICDVVLHAGIIALMGLWSFGIIMIGSVVVCCLPLVKREDEYEEGIPESNSKSIDQQASSDVADGARQGSGDELTHSSGTENHVRVVET
ncbi:sporulation-delaying protein SdpB family protein [Corynebacterium neomassiliense]|uniref:sporulation-delaying protein SdpB family protein n=1 Tax=Corynebacterium neomassiliense TaxID=2079482 RepID=UPI0010300A84|nr:sporulation-delaying protein SdpB family protein [Corynebacterium neomassiliense]